MDGRDWLNAGCIRNRYKFTGGQIFLSDLQRYFSGLGTAPTEGEGAASTGAGTAGAAAGAAGAGAAGAGKGTDGDKFDLGAMLSSSEALETATAPGNVQRLAQHLPVAAANALQDDVRTTLLSPQFAQVNP